MVDDLEVMVFWGLCCVGSVFGGVASYAKKEGIMGIKSGRSPGPSLTGREEKELVGLAKEATEFVLAVRELFPAAQLIGVKKPCPAVNR